MIPPTLDTIINAISGIASPLIKDKLQRNEIVIKLLNQFNLAPEHPPADFSGVYAYALVEYGVGKPKPFLELFRHEQIKQAFRKVLDHNNPSILLSEVDTFVDAYALGDEIKTLGLDIIREVAAFATVFIEVAKRSRTPSDALMSQQISSLHKRIAAIIEQLDRLPTLEGIRTEMARLASQNYPALPAVLTAVENNCQAIALAHRSLLEFFVAYKFAAELGALAPDFIELAQSQSFLDTGQCLKTLHGHMAWVRSIAFHPKGKTLISGGDDKTVRLWDITTAECLKTLQGNIAWVNSVSFSSSGHTLASGSYDHKVRLWDVTTGECLNTLQGHGSFVISVAYDPNGTTLASGSSDKTVRLWDIRTGKCLKILQGHNDWINSVAFSPDGTILASASGDKTVRLWEVETGQCIGIIQKYLKQVFSIAFSPDGTIIATGSGEATIMLWDFRNIECLKTLQGHTDYVYSVSFNHDGTIIASGSEDATVRLWNVNTGECIKILQHDDRVRSVSFTDFGRILISTSDDQKIKLWDVDSGECIKTLHGHTHAVTSAIFSPKAQILASGSRDETIKFWNIESGLCLKTLRSERPYEGMNIKGIKGCTEAEKATLKALGAIEEE
ncbi:hypothetical protein NUACC21_46820 [Scytonema sp. NUACC21]